MHLNVDVSLDHVVVEGVRIERPSRFSRAQWIEAWRPVDGGHQDAVDDVNFGRLRRKR